jgi:hypothetical protein
VYRTDALSELKSAALRAHVFTHLFTSNETSKQTYAGRFQDLDQIARSIVEEHKLDTIHDIGVSSGVTSLELYRTLATIGIPLRFHISDKYAVYGTTGRCPVRIIDAQGSVRELYICGVLAKRDNSVSKKFFPGTRFLHWLLANRPYHGPVRWFVLFDPEVLEHIDKGLIGTIDYDVFTTRMPDTFSLVRCMNLLNFIYFPSAAIETALRNIIESLKEGGVLQIGRTLPDGTTNATFYRKSGTRLEIMRVVGRGTELCEMIDRL